MKRLSILTIIVGLIPFGAVQALDLMGVYQMGRENDPQVRQVREQLNSARESKPQARALLLPNISVNGNAQRVDLMTQSTSMNFNSQYPRLNNLLASALNTGDIHDNYNQYSVDVQLLQPVFHRDYWIRLEQADDTITQAEAQLAAAEIDLMVRSATAYFNILAAADTLRSATAEKEANARQLEQAQQRFDVGLVAITDVHEAQAAYDGAMASEIAAENALSNTWEALHEIVGIIDQPLAKLGEDLPLSPPDPNDLEQWARTALAQNYGILAANAAVDLAEKNIQVESSGHYPTLDLVGSYGRQDSDSNLGIGSNADTGVIGLRLTVPLFQGGAVTSRTRQARHDLAVAQETLDQRRRAVNRQVRDAFRGVLSTISRVKALKSTVVSFQSALESTQAGLEVGTRTMVDVLSVTRSLYQAQRDYARARYDYLINGLLLHQAASTLTPELMEQANGWLTPSDNVAPPG